MATLAELTITSIEKSFDFLPTKVKTILVSGGGYRNKNLMNTLRKRLDAHFISDNEVPFSLDYMESELIAYLSARSLYNLPFTFPSTTGTSKITSGGFKLTYS